MTFSKMSRQGKTTFITSSLGFVTTLFFYNNCARQYDIQAVPTDSSLGAQTVNGPSSTDPNNVVPPIPTVGGQIIQKSLGFSSNNIGNKVDVLFVVDNSPSMNFEQMNLANKFSSFISQLNIRGLDWQIAIITTDGRSDSDPTGDYVSTNLDPVDGQFLKFRTKNSLGNYSYSNNYILNSTMDAAAVQAYFGDTIQRKADEGGGYEQAMYTTYRAIARAGMTGNRNIANKNFFRTGAGLSVVVLSDSDETPEDDQSLLMTVDGKNAFHEGVLDDNQVGFGVGHTIVHPASNAAKLELTNYVASKLPGKDFKFHSIVVGSNDTTCLGDKTSFYLEGFKNNLNEDFGMRYMDLSKKTGGTIGNICASDYGTQLTNLGTAVANQGQSIALDCSALDLNNDGKADIKVTRDSDGSDVTSLAQVVGKNIVIKSSLMSGSYTIQYSCNQ